MPTTLEPRRAHRGRRRGKRRLRRRPVWHPEIPEGSVAVVTDVTRRFGTDLTVGHGELVVLLGRSGTAGTDLLRCLGGLDRPVPGTVQVTGSVATVFREPRLLPWRSVQDNVALALLGTRLQAVRREKARRVLEDVGLGDRRAAWPAGLTPDEAARAALARGLVSRPDLLLVDDPFAPLAAGDRRRLARTVRRLWERERPAVLVTTDDPAVARALGGRVVPLDPTLAPTPEAPEAPAPDAPEKEHPACP
ncbi:ATP-binding cassette domain-containing protein [Nocardioides iriomotensis]|uniref:ATP-binding cassette domain-containing protein n=1 Tax=Nocardioides iriomotensis TaxID=715784 RepID=UPI0013EBC2FA|nr:ATP-binding cassette domain-containing protein [Nocardioides iriomotensis]